MNSEEALMVFDIGDHRAPRGLGAKKHIWSSKETPTLPIRFLSQNNGRAMLSIENENGTVYSNSIKVSKGVNVYNFNYSIGPAGIGMFGGGKKDKLKAADDGKYYLPAGEYTIKLVQGDYSDETKLELK